MPSTVRPDPSTLGMGGERGSRQEGRSRPVPGSCDESCCALLRSTSLGMDPLVVCTRPRQRPRWLARCRAGEGQHGAGLGDQGRDRGNGEGDQAQCRQRNCHRHEEHRRRQQADHEPIKDTNRRRRSMGMVTEHRQYDPEHTGSGDSGGRAVDCGWGWSQGRRGPRRAHLGELHLGPLRPFVPGGRPGVAGPSGPLSRGRWRWRVGRDVDQMWTTDSGSADGLMAATL